MVADGIKVDNQSTLKLGDYSELSGWTQEKSQEPLKFGRGSKVRGYVTNDRSRVRVL